MKRTVSPDGSSPRSWGTAAPPASGGSPARIIPTLVGNGRTRASSSPRSADHPHARGERARVRTAKEEPHGSSPRSWGTAFPSSSDRTSRRIIPTLVGNGMVSTDRFPSGVGSSPRSWGTGRGTPRGRDEARIIPTLVGNGGCSAAGPWSPADHPHARGERAAGRPEDVTCRWALEPGGSSPRSWGTGVGRRGGGAGERIIPTLVGNGEEDDPDVARGADHPHARGERDLPKRGTGSLYGSSPRSWGTEVGVDGEGQCRRIIPTLVGNGRPYRAAPCQRPDHPHARGERPDAAIINSAADGSSPRSWGTALPAALGGARCRIIPTLVGNGSCPERPWLGCWIIPTLVGNGPWRPTRASIRADHPHARGERRAESSAASVSLGSSPRSWGTGRSHDPRRPQLRIIPTLVGNGPGSRSARRSSSDHPHARGERGSPRLSFKGWLGSSPRSWGTDRQRPRPGREARIIPTLVGNGSKGRAAYGAVSDHPHARGERRRIHVWSIAPVGSSPRSWGTGGSTPRDRGWQRIIPTLVGNGACQTRPLPGTPDHPHARGERTFRHACR